MAVRIPPIGVSVASLFPVSFGPGGLDRAAEVVERVDGLRYLQLLPFRWYGEMDIHNHRDMIVSYEGAWNSGTAVQAWKRMRGKLSHPAPKPYDWILFGNEQEVAEREAMIDSYLSGEALHIVHGPTEYSEKPFAVELNPDAFGSAEEVRSLEGPVVIDTHHLFSNGANGGRQPLFRSNSDALHLMLSMIRQERLASFHFQPKRKTDELELFVEGGFTKLRLFVARWVKHKFPCPLILEIGYEPTLLTVNQQVQRLQRVVDAILSTKPEKSS